MSSTIKSKDRTSSSGQKFWHLKKLALGKTNTSAVADKKCQPLQRPPSPAESAFSVDAISLCDDKSITTKPKSKRLSGLLSHHRRQPNTTSGTNKVGPLSSNAKPNGMPTAMSVQNLSALSRSPSLRSVTQQQQQQQQQRGTTGSVRQRTMSYTTNAATVADPRAAFLRSRGNNNNNSNNDLISSPPQVTHHNRTCTKPNEDDDDDNTTTTANSGSLAARKRTLRPAASMANLRRVSDHDTHQSPPSSPTSPTSPRLTSFGAVQQQQQQRKQQQQPPRSNQAPSRASLPAAANKEDENEWGSNSSHEDTDSMSSSDSQTSEEHWRQKLEKEQAVVKALQRQKEACNKDITFLSHTLDELTHEKQALKQQFEAEKASRERIQDDLSGVTEKLDETRSQVKTLLSENNQLKASLEEQQQCYENKLKEQQSDLEKEKLRAQLRHTQDQVRVLKATMEQFLRMGIFSDDMSLYQDIASRHSTQLRASSVERLVQQHAPPTPPSTEDDVEVNEEELPMQPEQKQQQEIKSPAELDTILRELLREKELLQGEYSKVPISGAANALTRRRKEELEARLDDLDSQISKTKLKYRDFIKK